VVVRGVTNAGEPAVFEVQVKRTIMFAPGDAVFKGVVGQLAAAFPKLDLGHDRHQFAVATARTSFKITGPYRGRAPLDARALRTCAPGSGSRRA
jgi:hypothetical protein